MATNHHQTIQHPGTQRERKNNYKAHRQPTGTDASPIRIIDSNRISSSESLSSPSRHHQQRPTTKAALVGGDCVTAFACASFLFLLGSNYRVSIFLHLAKGRCSATQSSIVSKQPKKKNGGSIERLLNGKLVRSILRFPIQFFLSCSFTAHQRVVANRA